jgi:hypothetical protein
VKDVVDVSAALPRSIVISVGLSVQWLTCAGQTRPAGGIADGISDGFMVVVKAAAFAGHGMRGFVVSIRCAFRLGPVLRAVLLLHPAPLGVLRPKPFLGMAQSPISLFFCLADFLSNRMWLEGPVAQLRLHPCGTGMRQQLRWLRGTGVCLWGECQELYGSSGKRCCAVWLGHKKKRLIGDLQALGAD